VRRFARNRVSAHRLKQKPNIGERVGELLKQREHINVQATAKAIEKTALTKEWVIERLIENANRATNSNTDGFVLWPLQHAGRASGSSEWLGRQLGGQGDLAARYDLLSASPLSSLSSLSSLVIGFL
jgi:hypothetical protein